MNPFAEREMRLYHAALQYEEMVAVANMWHAAYIEWNQWEMDAEEMENAYYV